jgi:crotonobetainyl-CoA:carnitine CoA-transferase CaiB-like acyl-CoA transferase
VADVAGGSLMALIGLLAAVNQRHRTGRGQWVDAAMFDGVFSLATMVFGMVDAGLDQPGPGRMMLNGRLPCYNVYPTADGRYMALGALEPKFWVNFCRAVDREDLIPGQFGGPEVLDEAARIFGGRTQAEWVDFLADVDCCCEAVLTLDEAARSPLAASKNLVNRDAEGNRYLAPPLCLSDSPNADHRPAPALGADTRDVLLAAGLTRPEIDDLAKRGVIGL